MSAPAPDRSGASAASTDVAVPELTARLLSRFGSSAPNGIRHYDAGDVFAADDQGVLGLVESAHRGGQLELTESATSTFDTLAASAARQSVILESRAAAAVEMLGAAGIETRALKGLAVSHLDHARPEDRHFSDIDLLVRGGDIAEAVRLLATAGFRRHFREPFDRFDERIGKGVAVGDERGIVIDLHRTLALGYYGTRFPVPRLWTDGATFDVGGVSMAALDRPMRFVHCALHLALTPAPTMISGLDLAVIAAGGHLDCDAIVDAAAEGGCRAPLARAIATVSGWLGDGWAPHGLERWACDFDAAIVDRVALAAFEGRFAGSTARTATALIGLRGADRRLAIKGMFLRRRDGADA